MQLPEATNMNLSHSPHPLGTIGVAGNRGGNEDG